MEKAPPKGWKAEYAKSGRAACRTCKNPISQDSLRIAKVVQSTQFDGLMTMWHHFKCVLNKPGRIKSVNDVEGLDDLRWEDNQKLRKYIDDTKMEFAEETPKAGGGLYAVENAKSSRSTCKKCNLKIQKGEVRISTMVSSDSANYSGMVPAWRHATCFLKEGSWVDPPEKLPGWETLSDEDQEFVRSLVIKPDSAKGSKRKVGALEEDSAPISSEKKPRKKKGTEETNLPAGKKGRISMDEALEEDSAPVISESKSRKKKGSGEENTPVEKKGKGSKEKVLDEDSAPLSSVKKPRKKKGTENEIASVEKKGKVSMEEGLDKLPPHPTEEELSEFQRKFKRQNRELWALKDGLKNNVTVADLRTMLASNSMDVSGPDQALRDRCADGMIYGAFENCPMCQSPMEYHDGQYVCKGFLTEWSKCTYTTQKPERRTGKWKIPSDVANNNNFLSQWNKRQKATKEERLLLPPAEVKPAVKPDLTMQPKKLSVANLSAGPLGGLPIAFIGKPQPKWKALITDAGGIVSSVTEETYCVVTIENAIEQVKEKLQHAQSLNIPIVVEKYILDCLEKKTQLPIESYTIEIGPVLPAMGKVKVKGRSAVHPDSGLQDTGHILEVEKVIYNVTLNISDLSTGINSYYILQVIEDDKKKVCHIFRKWGRVGNSKIGSQKLEKLGKKASIDEFRRLFQEKTGNSWKVWEAKEELEKQAGKFYLVDIDFGIDEDTPLKGPVPPGSKSKLDPRVIKLMKLLFDIETYRAALMEFEINMSEMPLGKLSKRHIERGFQVLTEIQNLLTGDSAQKEGLLVDASNRFFTLIPSVHPNVIRDDKLLKSKIDMLEALRDIEIASQLIGSVGDSDEDPLDVNYGNLHCGISPLSHDSDNYKLVEKYLRRTHAPTHKEWQLELEDVFEVDRQGEFDAYTPQKKQLENRMLLWHGSRTTNFVGILSQGLRIAPPEAPATGYMFGKGLYFADLVSKSAQYCYTNKANPTGLLLLCEVALGKTKDLKSAMYMEKPMTGTHSTKGVGKTVPLESQFEIWDDNVTVPCGQPVPSAQKGSSLLYNEYIVYNTSQVRLRFLLKVKFKHKY